MSASAASLGNRLRGLARRLSDDSGQGVVEYALILALSSVAVVAALGVFGSDLAAQFDDIVDVVASL